MVQFQAVRPIPPAASPGPSAAANSAAMHARRWQIAAPFMVVAAAALASYSNTFSVPFVLDDFPNIVLASRVHALALTPAALAEAAAAFPLGRWLAHVSFAANHALGGMDPVGYHAVTLAITIAWAVRKRMPLLAFATAWFLVALALEQTVLPLHFVFEHRLYLPSLGWFVLVAWGLERSVSRVSGSGWLVAGLVLSALALATFVRNAEWNDPVRLYADSASQAPGHAGQLPSLGTELKERARARVGAR